MRERVLIVDDEPRPRASLAAGLRSIDFEVTEAGSAEEALRQLESAEFDVAVVDLMSGLKGLHLARQMRADHSHLPVVLTSAYCLTRGQLARANVDAVAFVPKPYCLDDLAAHLRDCAAKSRKGTSV